MNKSDRSGNKAKSLENKINKQKRNNLDHRENKENLNFLSNSSITTKAKPLNIKEKEKEKGMHMNNLVKTPFLGQRKNYQEETEKNEKRSSIKNVIINNMSESVTAKILSELMKDSSSEFPSRSASEIKGDVYLEDLFIKKPKLKTCISNYYSVDMWNLKEEFLHPFIPLSKIDNSSYKLAFTRKYLKKPQLPDWKTDSCVNLNHKRNFTQMNSKSTSIHTTNINTKLNFTENLSKRRKASSVKKIYESTLEFIDEDKNKHFFGVYEDKNVGFDFRYNQILKEMEMDNDVVTDEEQLYLATKHVQDSMRSVMENFNVKLLNNKMRFKRSRSNAISNRR